MSFNISVPLNLIGGEQVFVYGLEGNGHADPTPRYNGLPAIIAGAYNPVKRVYPVYVDTATSDVIDDDKIRWLKPCNLKLQQMEVPGADSSATEMEIEETAANAYLLKLQQMEVPGADSSATEMEIEETAANANDGDDLSSQVSVVLFRGVPHPRTHTRFHLMNPHALPSLPDTAPHHHSAKFATHRRLSERVRWSLRTAYRPPPVSSSTGRKAKSAARSAR